MKKITAFVLDLWMVGCAFPTSANIKPWNAPVINAPYTMAIPNNLSRTCQDLFPAGYFVLTCMTLVTINRPEKRIISILLFITGT